MTELQIPVWMEDFNGSGQITSDWKMWHNGYDRHLLKDFFVENYPDILQHQTLREISSPMFPGESSRDHFRLVDLSTNQDPYYYPIAIHWWSLLDQLLEQTLKIPDFITNQIANSDINVKILLFNNREQWGEPTWRTTINRIKSINPHLTDDDFVVSCNNPDLADLNSVPVIANQTIEQYTAWWDTHQEMWQELSRRIKNRDSSRPFKLVCLMRRPNASRWALSAELMEYKHQGAALMSMVLDTQLIEQNGPLYEKLTAEYYHHVRTHCIVDGKFTIGDYQSVGDTYPASTDKLHQYQSEYPFWIEHDTNALTNPIRDPAIWKFIDSYLHIVSETFTNSSNGVCLSEKTFKPIWYMQPFIIFGTPGTLVALRDMGYQTFDQWIDESYDQIENVTDRFYAAINSIHKFCQRPVTELDSDMIEMLPTLQHNAKLLQYNNTNFIKNSKTALTHYILQGEI